MSLQIFVALATFASAALAQNLQVNTPTSVQACLPVAITWTGGTRPVYISLIPGGQATGAIVHDFGPQQSNSLTWIVDKPVGTSYTIQARDSSGNLNYSDKFQILNSTQTCKLDSTGSSGTPGSTSPLPTGGNTTKPGSPTSTPSTGATTPSTSNTAATTGSSPVAQAGASDASRTIPGLFALAAAGALAIFA